MAKDFQVPFETAITHNRLWLVALLVLMLGLVGVFVNGLKQSYDEKLARATTDSQNMARVLEEEINSVVLKTDVLLRHIATEAIKTSGDSAQAAADARAYLKKIKSSVPEVFGIRIIQPDGYSLASSLEDKTTRTYYGDRAYFQRHRTNPDLGLDISEPIVGRAHRGWQVMLSRRLNSGDGSFAGIVSSGIALSYFEEFFSSLDLGKNSTITLLSKDLRVITRFPLSEGQRMKSVRDGPIAAALQINPLKGTVMGKSSVDGMERIFSYRQVGNLPLVVVVGLSRRDVLAEWRRNALIDGTVMAVLLAAVGWLSFSLMRLHRKEQENINQLQEITSTLGEGVYVLDREGRVTFVNPEAERLLGWSQAELLGKNGHETFHYEHMDGSPIATEACPIHQTILSGQTYHTQDDNLVRKDGTTIPVSMVSSPIVRNGKVMGSVASFQDITDQKRIQNRISHMAQYDGLTDLPNRALFYDRLRQGLSLAKRSQHGLALMFLDLDRFKEVNDTLGHHVGDLLLKNVADRLRHCVRESDTVARLGGDEFTVLLYDLREREDIGRIAQKIVEALSLPYRLDERDVQIGVSIGIARFTDDTEDEDKLMNLADKAMYTAKAEGRNTYRFCGN